MEYKIRQRVIVFVLLIAGFLSGYSQSKLSVLGGFNFFNRQLENLDYGAGYINERYTQSFFLSPQIGISYQINPKHYISYIKSLHIEFAREYVPSLSNIINIRNLDRLQYQYNFKSGYFLALGITYHLNRGEAFYSTAYNEKHVGNFGLNLGVGKKFQFGSIAFSNLLALEFQEMTPASLYGYWVFDFIYDINLNQSTRIEKRQTLKNQSAVFGIGLLSSVNYFDQRALLPAHPIFSLNVGFDMHYFFPMISTELFWRRSTSIFFQPIRLTEVALFSTRWDNLGFRFYPNLWGERFFLGASFLAGYDATLTYSHVLGGQSTISGFSIMLGHKKGRWQFDLTFDCYLNVPIEEISSGFKWDRIKLAMMYDLPIITK